MDGHTRRRFLVAAGVAAAAGCTQQDGSGSGNPTPAGGDRSGTGGSGQSETATPTPRSVAASVPTADRRLPLPVTPSELRSEARSGGPSKDGIPSIDDPSFVDPGEADFLDPGDPVFGVARDGDVRAYPQKVLVSHEIVNDVLGGDPVGVTYCPLTGTAQGFERGETEFGVSGRLINNNLVMYDRTTEAWWPQILATAIPGPWHGSPETRSLREFRLVWTTWEAWQSEHPETDVLSTETGYVGNYGDDPYGSYNPPAGYYSNSRTLFPSMSDDDRYHPKEVVIGARTPEGAVAFHKDSLRSKRVLAGDLGGTPVVAVHGPRLDTAYVYENPDGTVVEYADGRYRTEDGTDYAADDLPLSRVYAFDAMWFAWNGFYPDANVYE